MDSTVVFDESLMTIAMGAVMKKISDNRDKLPVVSADDCIMNTFDDIELGRLGALSPCLPFNPDESEMMSILDNAYCKSSESRDLIMAVWKNGRYLNLDELIDACYIAPETIEALSKEKEARVMQIIRKEVKPRDHYDKMVVNRLLIMNRIDDELLSE